jgi:DNA-binding transcriptional ArsR family regulator
MVQRASATRRDPREPAGRLVHEAGATDAAGDPFEALGDPNRRAIVELLGAGDRSVQQLADSLPISRPAVSRHLRLLKDAGLVVEEPRGTRRIYRLHDEGVEAVRAYLQRVWGDAAGRFRLVAENTTGRPARSSRRGRPASHSASHPAPRSEPGPGRGVAR